MASLAAAACGGGGKNADAFTLPRFSSIQRVVPFLTKRGTNKWRQQQCQKQIVLREQKEKSFFDYFTFESDPKLRKSLGIGANETTSAASNTPHPPLEPPPLGLYLSEEKAELSIPYDAAAKFAYEQSDKKMNYQEFKAKYEPDAVADVIRKNGGGPELIKAKMEELKQSAYKQSLASNSPDTEGFNKATKVVVDTFVVSNLLLSSFQIRSDRGRIDEAKRFY